MYMRGNITLFFRKIPAIKVQSRTYKIANDSVIAPIFHLIFK